MELKMERNDWMFFLLCLIVAIVAEEIFLYAPPDWYLLFYFYCYLLYVIFLEVSSLSFYTSKTWLSFINSYLDFSSRVLSV